MKFAPSCLLAVLALSLERAATLRVAGGESPIAKVVTLLEEMLKASMENAAKDEELYGKFKAYCDETTEKKTESISGLAKDIALLENKVVGLQASTGDLSADTAKLYDAMHENEAACKAAENLRQKENADFMEEQADLEAATGSLEKAIKTLAEVGADQTTAESAGHKQFMAGYIGAPAPAPAASLAELKTTLRTALSAASAVLTLSQRKAAESFLQVVQAPFTGTYSAQSGEIVGILKSMLETYDANLKIAIAEEKTAEVAHKNFMKAKKEAYDEMKANYDKKVTAMGGNDDDLAGKKEQLAAAKDEKTGDEDILSKLLPLCKEKARQFESRKRMRASEQAAVSQTLNILQSDAAASTFKNTKATSSGGAAATLLQLGSSRRETQIAPRAQAQAILIAVAAKRRSLRLSRIATLIASGNPFNLILEKIDEVIELIGEEGKADKENLEWCDAERNSNDKDLKDLKENIETLESEMEDIDVAINDPASGLLVQIKDAETQLTGNEDFQVKETKMRAEENMAYQKNIRDLAEAEELLAEAMAVLKTHYKEVEEQAEQEEEDAVFLQRLKQSPPATTISTSSPSTIPETWADEDVGAGFQGQSEKGKDIVEMIASIKNEVHDEEMAAHDAEKEAQHGYEDNMKAVKEKCEQLEKSISDLKAEAEEKGLELNQKGTAHEKSVDSEEAVEAYLEKIKPGCEWISTNFGVREENREVEIKALENVVKLLKESPGWTAAVAAAEQASWGDCLGDCLGQKEHAECKACLAGTTVVGYCASHPGTAGC